MINYSYEGDRIRQVKDGRTMGFINEHDEDRDYWMGNIKVSEMIEPVHDFVIDSKYFDGV